MGSESLFGGLFGLILLILVLVAALKTLNSSASNQEKIVWILILVFIPVIGLIVWFFMGPGE